MKVLLLSYEFRPWVGGIGTYAEELAASFALAGDEVVVLAPDYSIEARPGWKGTVDETDHPTGRTEHPEPDPFEVRRFTSGRGTGPLSQMWSLAGELNREIDRFAPDALLLLDLHGTMLFSLAQLRRGGARRVQSVLPILHGSEIYHLQKGRKARLFGRRVLDSVPYLYTNSEWTRELLNSMGESRWYNRAKVAGIGVARRFHQTPDTTASVEELRTRWKVAPGRRVLLTVARLVDRKGIDHVLQCWSRLPVQLRSDWHYVIVGLGPERGALERIVQSLGLSDSVTFGGSAPGSELPTVYDCCDLYVQLSREVDGTVEGLGLTFLEAAARSKPSLATWHGGIPEAIADGESGRLVPPGDLAAATEALETLMQDEHLREKLGIQAKARVRERFNWQDVRSRLVADL